MTETTIGREPLQIVEIKQPFCQRRYGILGCPAGLGSVATTAVSDLSNYTATNGSLSSITGGIRLTSSAFDAFISMASTAPGFAGSDFRYVVVHGKMQTVATTPQFVLLYGTASLGFAGTRQMSAINFSTKFRDVQLDAIQAGQEFIAVFDAATSTNYATDWQGNTITRLRFDAFANHSHIVDIYSITVCTQNLISNADSACYNTRATCRNPETYSLGDPLSLYFGKGLPAENGLVPYMFKGLESVSTSPTKMNLAGASLDAQGLGNRALCNVSISDFQHSDRVVDPYASDRSWNPLDRSRGSFWTRWIARNRYRQGIQIQIYEGYAGQALASMQKRLYFWDSISHPGSGVTIAGKDILARVEERKAQAPLATQSELKANITNSQTSFIVIGAVDADFPSSGILRIGEEIMTYSGKSFSAGDTTFTGVVRGQENTTAAAHNQADAVQLCLKYENMRPDDIIEDLLTTFAGIDPAWLDLAGWATEITEYLPSYLLTTLITEPRAVADHVSEVQNQALINIWWDERDQLVKLKAVRAVDEPPPVISEEYNILADSFSITEKPRERVSQVWIPYGRRDYVKSFDDIKAYAYLQVVGDLESETDVKYGEKSIRRIYGTWLPTTALAANTGSKIITRFSEVPYECEFSLDAKDRQYSVGDVVSISHHLDVDEFGDRRLRFWTIVSFEEIVPGEIIRYVAEDTTLYGKIHYVMATGAANYPGYDSAPVKNAYIGNAAGLLSDLEPCARIS